MKRLFVLLALALAFTARADEKFLRIGYENGLADEQKIEVRLNTNPASPFPGGYGYAVVEITNPDARPHTVSVSIRSTNSRVRFSVDKVVELPAKGRGRVTLPLSTGTAGSMSFDAIADGYVPGAQSSYFNESEQRAQPTLLAVRDSRLAAEPFVDIFRSMRGAAGPRTRGSATVDEFDSVVPADLPDAISMLSGYAVIVVDAAAQGLDEGKQELLLDYARAGGTLLVFHHRADDSPLGRLVEGDYLENETTRVGTLDFGAFATVASGEAPSGEIRDRLGETFRFVIFQRGAMNSGFAPEQVRGPLLIPGLGGVKVKLFVILILGFVLLIGVVTWRSTRKRRNAVSLIWKIPALGLGFAAMIVIFGLVSEGIGIRGRIVSVTLLDQDAHRAVSISARAIYAGLSADRMRLDSSSTLSSSQLQFDVFGDRNHELAIDLDQERAIGTGLIPSRTPTKLEIVSVASARDRLRFERAGPNYRLLASDEFAPLGAKSSIVFRDLDGKYFEGSNRSDLVPISAEVAAASLGVLVNATYGAFGGGEFATEALLSPLRPGEYVALVARAPFVEDLGLDVEYQGAEHHLVRGRVAQEDVK